MPTERLLLARYGARLGGWREKVRSRDVRILSVGEPVKIYSFLGKYQARILSESLLTPAEYQKEVSYELVTGKVDSLGAFFSTLCPGRLIVRQK